MAEVVQDAQEAHWRAPTVLGPLWGAALPAATEKVSEACKDCGTEFMIGAGFCHACGLSRSASGEPTVDKAVVVGDTPSARLGMTRTT